MELDGIRNDFIYIKQTYYIFKYESIEYELDFDSLPIVFTDELKD